MSVTYTLSLPVSHVRRLPLHVHVVGQGINAEQLDAAGLVSTGGSLALLSGGAGAACPSLLVSAYKYLAEALKGGRHLITTPAWRANSIPDQHMPGTAHRSPKETPALFRT